MEKKQKGIIIIVLLLITACIIPFVIFSLQFFALDPGNGGGELDPIVYYDELPTTPVLSDIQPDPDMDGVISLDWSSSTSLWYYNVYRRKSGFSEVKIRTAITSSSCTDSAVKDDGTYYYRIEAKNNKGAVWSNEESVVITVPYIPPLPPVYPSNPSIIINDDGTPDGINATNSFEVTLTLYCDDAEEMQFQISPGMWTNWTAYSTTYDITLLENDPNYPDYRIGVVFRNDEGTTIDAGYGDIYDDIIYDPDVKDYEGPGEDEEEPDYTLAYVLVGILIGLIGIGIFLKYRKRIIKSKPK